MRLMIISVAIIVPAISSSFMDEHGVQVVRSAIDFSVRLFDFLIDFFYFSLVFVHSCTDVIPILRNQVNKLRLYGFSKRRNEDRVI